MGKWELFTRKVLKTCVWIVSMLIGFALFSAQTHEADVSNAGSPDVVSQVPDVRDVVNIKKDDKKNRNHSKDGFKGRALSQYYSRRQYLGSPPEIPHPEKVHGKDLECLICHADGGWTSLLKRVTPVTPHPEMTGCLQCHVSPVMTVLFKEIDWQSLRPPPLGGAYLPGAPPPIPHDLQMRGNCNACHLGPGTLMAIRMKHEWRGTCRQCHLPEASVELFRR